jgi:hypothetical protein
MANRKFNESEKHVAPETDVVPESALYACCGAPVPVARMHEDYCHGCQSFICEKHDDNPQQGRHSPSDHWREG